MFSIKTLINSVHSFFFKDHDTKGIGLFRIIWGVLLFAYFLFEVGNLDNYYGTKSILSLKSSLGQFNYPHLNIFQYIGVEDQTLYSFMAIYGIAIICFTIGFYTKQTLIILFICMVSLHQRNIWLLSSCDLLIRLITFYLIFTPCERSISLDQSRLNLKQAAPVWGLRLIQIQISVVYIWTVWQKLKGESWLDGTAVYYATRLEAFKNVELPWLLDSMFNLKVISWGTLMLEFGIGVLVWFKECKKLLVLIGIIFHLGIEVLMSIPFFEIVMIILLSTYILDELVFTLSKLMRNKSIPQVLLK
jgi:hypothetical protein